MWENERRRHKSPCFRHSLYEYVGPVVPMVWITPSDPVISRVKVLQLCARLVERYHMNIPMSILLKNVLISPRMIEGFPSPLMIRKPSPSFLTSQHWELHAEGAREHATAVSSGRGDSFSFGSFLVKHSLPVLSAPSSIAPMLSIMQKRSPSCSFSLVLPIPRKHDPIPFC